MREGNQGRKRRWAIELGCCGLGGGRWQEMTGAQLFRARLRQCMLRHGLGAEWGTIKWAMQLGLSGAQWQQGLGGGASGCQWLCGHAHGRVEKQAGRDKTGSGWVKPEASSGAVPRAKGALSTGRRAGDTIVWGHKKLYAGPAVLQQRHCRGSYLIGQRAAP